MDPQLSFIIVNWNGGELLHRCLESIIAYPPSIPYDIVIVDNASTDESLAWLRSEELKQQLAGVSLTLIENTDNAGFGKANNQAFAASRAPYLFLLNADAELRPETCDVLLRTLKSDDRIGACGPRLINPDGSLQVSVWRNPPTAWATLLSGLRLSALLPSRLRGELLLAEFWDHARRRDVPMLGGAAILVKHQVVDEVGGFDERFHMYGEDNEWCLRIVRAGWRIVFEPKAIAMHHGAQGSRQRWTDLQKLRVQTESYLRFLHQSLPRRLIFTNLLASVGMLGIQKTLRKIQSRPQEEVDLVLSLYLDDLRSGCDGSTLAGPSR